MYRTGDAGAIAECVGNGSLGERRFPDREIGEQVPRRVSQARRPRSTREAASIVVIDFVMEPIIIMVSGVTGRVLPISLTPKPLR